MPCVTITGLYSAVIILFELALFVQRTQTDDVNSQSRTKAPVTLFSSSVLVWLFILAG